jgi:hypothetical protein
MTGYTGSIRVHVSDSSERELIPEAEIDDLTAASWHTATIRGAVPVTDVVGVLVELMDGDRAGWTARARAHLDGDTVRIEGTEAFMPGT